MRSVYALPAFIGVLVGAIVNWLADSLPSSSPLKRPCCINCGAPRPVSAWVGLAAPLLGGWRCAHCGATRSMRAPIIELLAAAGAVWLYARSPAAADFWPALLIAAVFLLIGVIDAEHRLVLFAVTVPASLCFALLGSLDPERGPIKTLLGGAAGFAIVYGFYLLGGLFAKIVARMRGRELDEIAFGFGDVMLALVIGLVVGWPGIVTALFLGVLAAGVGSLGYLLVMLFRHRYTPLKPIPYGPFLLAGACLVRFVPDLLRATFAR